MPDIGPLNPNKPVKIAYPDIPANLLEKFNNLIASIDQTSTNLNGSGTRVQTFMGQANKAVQNVSNISQGKATQALIETWFYSTVDGNHAQTGMTDAANHLKTTTRNLDEHLQAIKEGVQAVETLQANGGWVSEAQSEEVQQQIDNLTSALGNIGMALDAAATLIKALNNDMPSACATGFVPGGVYPTFSDNSFNKNQMNMSGKGGSGSKAAEQAIKDAIDDPVEADALIELAKQKGANLDDVSALLKQGIDSKVVAKLVDNEANLQDIAANSQTLINGKVNVNLINSWLNNGTNLKAPIDFMKQGVDLNLIGTSNKVGDFTNIANATPNEIISRVPKDAKLMQWVVNGPDDPQAGMKFIWKPENEPTYRLEMHSQDPKVVAQDPNLNAGKGWIIRVQRGNKYIDTGGNWITQNAIDNSNSSNYNPDNANNTHIPIQPPPNAKPPITPKGP